MKPESIFLVDTPEESPGFLLWQVTTLWQRLIKKALEPYGIPHAQFVILAILLWFEGKNEDQTQIMIAKQSKLDKMTVSKSLKNLAETGYIQRLESEKDSRAKWVRLTDQGRKLASQLVPVVEQVDEEFFKVISNPAQRKTLLKTLETLVEE